MVLSIDHGSVAESVVLRCLLRLNRFREYRMRNFAMLLAFIFLTGCQNTAFHFQDDASGKKFKVLLKIDDSKKETILILHNCAGVSEHTISWANQVAKWGYHAVVMDSFYTYGTTYLCAGGPHLAEYPYKNSKDAETVGDWIKKQPWSNGKVSVIGFSAGANTGILISTTANTHQPSKLFSSVVAYYPNCFPGVQERNLSTPLMVLVGEKDNWVNVNECKEMSKRSKFKDVEFHFYPNAEHNWDDGSSGSAKCWRGTCSWSYDREADEKSRQATKEFLERNFK